VLQHLHIANSSLISCDTSFAVRRYFLWLLYSAEYKYSGFGWGKFGKCEEGSGNRVGDNSETTTLDLKITSTHLFQISVHSLNGANDIGCRPSLRPTKIHQTYRLTIYITLILLCDPVTGLSNALPSQP
jgi:hypothetical protein